MRPAYITSTAVLALLCGVGAHAACPPERDLTLTLGEYLGAYEECATRPADAHFEEQAEAAEEAISARPTSTAGGNGFAGDLRGTIEDFLPLFKIGLSSLTTSEDGRALDLRFNPIRTGAFGALGLTATVTEPKAGDHLLQSLPEGRRSAATDLVAAQVDDFSDVTLTARWGYERTHGEDEVPKRMWGRSLERYRPIVEQWMGKTVEPEIARHFRENARVGDCETEISMALTPANDPEVVQPRNVKLADIEGVLGSARYEDCLTAYEQDRDAIAALDLKLGAFALIPALIDNQPQLVLTVARHERDPLVGRNGWGGKVVYEHGFHNFNRVLRLFHRERADLQDVDARALAFWTAVEGLDLQKVQSENKLTFSAAYQEGESLAMSQTFGEGDDAVTAVVDLPRSTEWCIEGEYVRNASWHPMQVDGTTVYPRFHASLEYVDVSDDPQRQDRGVVKLTYDLPITPTITVPLSLTYANHAEFLGEHDEQFSAHLGFSFKLPWDEE